MGSFAFNARIVSIALTLLLVLGIGSNAWASDNSEKFQYPVKNSEVVRHFVEPVHPFGAGHRGVDFKAKSGTKIFAPAKGQVIFAGMVAGGLHVSINHGNDLVSTSTYLATKSVQVGDIVEKGDLLGTSSSALGQTEETFHFSIRDKGVYVDPLAFLENKVQREIYLAPIDKGNKSLFEKLGGIERAAIEALLDVGSFVIDKATGLPILNDAVLNALKELGSVSLELFKSTQELINEAKDVALKIASHIAKNALDHVEAGIKHLRFLEKQIIESVKHALISLGEFNYEILKLFKEALTYGVDAAKFLIETLGPIFTFPSRMAFVLAQGLVDLIATAGITSLKILDQFVEIDLPTLLRQLLLPGSCLLASCASAVVMKCDVVAPFEVKTKAKGYKGSGNQLLFASGIRTKGDIDPATGKLNPTSTVPLEKLGYDNDSTQYFSYNGMDTAFEIPDTFGSLDDAAQKMDEQIKSFKRNNPGEKLDLMGHSLGGAVIGMWLAKHYDPDNNQYPELGKVILLAAPISGTSFATAGSYVDSIEMSKEIHDFLANKANMPDSSSKAIQQVEEDGELARLMNESGAAKKVDIYSVRLGSDMVVSAGSKPVEGVNEIILNSGYLPDKTFLSHFDVTSDVKSLSSIQAILEDRLPPCENIIDAAGSVIHSSIVHAGEVTLGRAIRESAKMAL